jgi:hypothetical protein
VNDSGGRRTILDECIKLGSLAEALQFVFATTAWSISRPGEYEREANERKLSFPINYDGPT